MIKLTFFGSVSLLFVIHIQLSNNNLIFKLSSFDLFIVSSVMFRRVNISLHFIVPKNIYENREIKLKKKKQNRKSNKLRQQKAKQNGTIYDKVKYSRIK